MGERSIRTITEPCRPEDTQAASPSAPSVTPVTKDNQPTTQRRPSSYNRNIAGCCRFSVSLAASRSDRLMAGTTGLEPATSAVTGQRSNQLSYVPLPSHPDNIRLSERSAASHTARNLHAEITAAQRRRSISLPELSYPTPRHLLDARPHHDRSTPYRGMLVEAIFASL